MTSNQQLSEQYRLAGKEQTEADAAASLLEEMKSAILSQRKKALGDIADSRAETIVKASPEWAEYIEKMVEARKTANMLRVKVEWIRMRHREWISADANQRAEMKL